MTQNPENINEYMNNLFAYIDKINDEIFKFINFLTDNGMSKAVNYQWMAKYRKVQRDLNKIANMDDENQILQTTSQAVMALQEIHQSLSGVIESCIEDSDEDGESEGESEGESDSESEGEGEDEDIEGNEVEVEEEGEVN